MGHRYWSVRPGDGIVFLQTRWGNMNNIEYIIKKGSSCKVHVEIPKLDSLPRYDVWRKQPIINRNQTIQRLNSSIPSKGGVYFLFYSDERLLYIGKAANIRQRLNFHTGPRTIREIAEEKKRNPKHIFSASWILTPDAGARDIIETAYLRTYGTAWNSDKIDKRLNYPEAPKDQYLDLPEVQKYIQKQNQIMRDVVAQI